MATQQTNADGVTYTNYQRDTPEANKQEKRALLAMMAEKGTEGAAEYERNKQITKDTRASSVEMAAARGNQVHAPSTLQAENEQDYDAQMAGILANTDDGMLSHAREMDRISAANGAYIDAAAAASQLQADQLDKGMLGGGGGGGGGRGGGGGGGGGGGSSFDEILEGTVRTLEEAGAMAGGSENPGTVIDGVPVSGSGVRRMFGDEFDPDAPWGNDRLVSLRENLTAAIQSGVDKDVVAETLITDLRSQLEQGLISPHQFSFAASSMDNYLGLTGEGQRGEATVQAYSLADEFGYGDAETYEAANPYSQEGRDRETNNLDRKDGLGSLMGGTPALPEGVEPADMGKLTPEFQDRVAAMMEERFGESRREKADKDLAIQRALLEFRGQLAPKVSSRQPGDRFDRGNNNGILAYMNRRGGRGAVEPVRARPKNTNPGQRSLPNIRALQLAAKKASAPRPKGRSKAGNRGSNVR